MGDVIVCCRSIISSRLGRNHDFICSMHGFVVAKTTKSRSDGVTPGMYRREVFCARSTEKSGVELWFSSDIRVEDDIENRMMVNSNELIQVSPYNVVRIQSVGIHTLK